MANALRHLLREHARPYWHLITVILAFQVVQTVTLLYLPTLNADIIDNGVLTGDTGYILRLGGLMLALTVLQVTCMIIAVRYGAYTAMAIGRDLRAAVFDRVQSFSSREISLFGVPSLVMRTTNDVQQVQTLAQATLIMLPSAPIMGVGAVALALAQDVPLALVLLTMVPLLALLMMMIVRRLRPLFRTLQAGVDRVNQVMREQISGVRVIRAFNRDEFEQQRFMVANTALTDVSVQAGRLTTMMFPLAATVVNLFSVLVVWVGAYRVDDGATQIGAFVAFLGYLTLILVAVVTATFTLMMVPRAEVCAERIVAVRQTQPSIRVPPAPRSTMPRPGHLDLNSVDFSYPGAEAPVLQGVDLVARPGEVTAVTGSIGSGKSTLLELIPRLADVTGGRVLVGGVDVRETDPSTLARAVALVPQKARLFTGTVSSNLRYGREDATDTELWQALELAQAREFVAELGGLEAPVSQGGANLSGGQRQRLSIARALVRRPQIYLFDDPFSALDMETEARLRSALARELAEATVVMVAQRVATIRGAHRIVVLESGAVAGSGTHDELITTSPVYQEIVRSQRTEEGAG